MIRIDILERNESYVSTRWVEETSNTSSLMGRLVFSKEEWENFPTENYRIVDKTLKPEGEKK